MEEPTSLGAGTTSPLEHATSLPPGETASSTPAPTTGAVAESSSNVAGSPGRRCGWCRSCLEETARSTSVYCGKKCRQTAFRLRKRGIALDAAVRPIRVAYADPPYPGLSWRYYKGEEVDHAALIVRLMADFPEGWALSTGAYALREVLPLCPPSVRVCAWSKPHGAHPATHGLHNVWEALLVVGGRQRPPGVRDHLSALPARGGGELPGRKPLAFIAWCFACLGLQPGDELIDLFPGTGVVGRAWAEASRRSSATVARVLATSPGDDATSPMEDATGDV